MDYGIVIQSVLFGLCVYLSVVLVMQYLAHMKMNANMDLTVLAIITSCAWAAYHGSMVAF